MTQLRKTEYTDLWFKDWCRENLTDSRDGLNISDIDLILQNWKTKNVMILEIKCFMQTMTKPQWWIYRQIDYALKQTNFIGYNYKGVYLLRFRSDSINDDIYIYRLKFDEKEEALFVKEGYKEYLKLPEVHKITESELKYFLSNYKIKDD
jgi:hypothetical protein